MLRPLGEPRSMHRSTICLSAAVNQQVSTTLDGGGGGCRSWINRRFRGGNGAPGGGLLSAVNCRTDRSTMVPLKPERTFGSAPAGKERLDLNSTAGLQKPSRLVCSHAFNRPANQETPLSRSAAASAQTNRGEVGFTVQIRHSEWIHSGVS